MPEASFIKVTTLIIEAYRNIACEKNIGGFCTAYGATCNEVLTNMSDW